MITWLIIIKDEQRRAEFDLREEWKRSKNQAKKKPWLINLMFYFHDAFTSKSGVENLWKIDFFFFFFFDKKRKHREKAKSISQWIELIFFFFFSFRFFPFKLDLLRITLKGHSQKKWMIEKLKQKLFGTKFGNNEKYCFFCQTKIVFFLFFFFLIYFLEHL